MTIVQCIETPGPGGAEQIVLDLCRRMRGHGHRVLPLLLKSGWLSDLLEADRFDVCVLPLAAPIDPDFARRLRAFLRETETDVLHSHEITFAAYGRVATAGLGIGHLATAHGRNFAGGWKRRGFGTLFLRRGAHFRLAAVSGALARELGESFFLDSAEIAVVENGVELPPERPGRRRGPGDALRVIAVGNLYPVKNHGVLLHAISILSKAGVSAELDILGRGSEEGALQQLARELGLADRVRLLGFRSDVSDFLSRADVFASSSVSEGMPLSLLEAMGHGLPVVASRVGGVPVVVEDGVHGFLFESGDASGAAAGLLRLAANEDLRQRFGAAASVKAREQFGAPAMVRRYEALYTSLVAGRAA